MRKQLKLHCGRHFWHTSYTECTHMPFSLLERQAKTTTTTTKKPGHAQSIAPSTSRKYLTILSSLLKIQKSFNLVTFHTLNTNKSDNSLHVSGWTTWNNSQNRYSHMDKCAFFCVHSVASCLLRTQDDETHTCIHLGSTVHLQCVPTELLQDFLMTANWPNVTKVRAVILNPHYSPSSLSAAMCRATMEKLSLSTAWSQSTCHQTCMGVCRDEESVYQVGRLCASIWRLWRLISVLSSTSESLLCMSMCVSILHYSLVTEHSMQALWSSQVCTSPVTLAE